MVLAVLVLLVVQVLLVVLVVQQRHPFLHYLVLPVVLVCHLGQPFLGLQWGPKR